MNQSHWTALTIPERENLIRPMILEQLLSYTQIAAALNITRQTVAGVANRARIVSPYSRGVKPGVGRKGAAAKHARAPKRPGKQPTQAKRPHAFVAGYIPEAAIDRRPARADAWNALPGTNPRPLHELEAHDCRWPIGPDTAPFQFCGAPAADGPWCPEHRLLAYKPRTPVKFSGRKSQ